jgi:hypothetical protein
MVGKAYDRSGGDYLGFLTNVFCPVMSENQICLRLLGLPLAPKPGVTRRYAAENRFLTLS